MAHEADGDLGYEWLKTNSAGSGSYKLRQYKPSDSYVLEAVPDGWRGDPPLARVFMRHVAEPATQRLLLENGDIDIARKLTPVDIAGIARQPGRQGRRRAARPHLLPGAEPEGRAAEQPQGHRGGEVPDRLRGHGRQLPEGQQRRAPVLPAGGLPRRHRRQALHARRREGEGAARGGRRRPDQRQALRPQRPGAAGDRPVAAEHHGAGRHQRRAPRRHRRRDPRRVPRAQPRDDHGGLGAGLSRPAHQRRHLRPQPRQQRRGQATPASSPGATPGRRPRPTT